MSLITQADKERALVEQLDRREREVFDYQMEIDNLDRALVKWGQKYPGLDADTSPELEHARQYAHQLRELARQNREQQERSQVMLDVIRDQLDGVDISQYRGQTE